MTGAERSLADWVADQVCRGSGVRLPTMRDLASGFGLSVGRVSKVLHALADKGILEISRKRGITIPRTPQAGQPATAGGAADAFERLYRVFASGIQEGLYASGSALPKVAVAAREHRASRATVCRTYERLRREGFVHRRGRRNIVGNGAPGRMVGAANKGKCVIVVQRHPNAFRDMMVHRWTRDFALAFIREMSLAGGRAIPVSASETEPGVANQYGGRKGIADLVAQLGERCVGFLVAGQAWFYSTQTFVELHELIAWLCTFGRPVVWFDSMDTAGYYRNEEGTREKIRGILAKPHVRKRFARCRFDECGALRLVARAVSLAGFETLRIPQLSVPTPHSWSWADQRCDLLRSVVDKDGHPLELEVRKPVLNPTETAESVLNELGASQRPVREYVLSTLRRPMNTEFHELPRELRYILELSLLSAFVDDPGPRTCILALNDHMAHAYCRRLELMGGNPSHIRALVSFDDCLDVLFPYQVSSVNFGFDLLGHQAFHFLLRDLPLRVGRSRTIDAVPRLAHLHTLQPAPGRRGS